MSTKDDNRQTSEKKSQVPKRAKMRRRKKPRDEDVEAFIQGASTAQPDPPVAAREEAASDQQAGGEPPAPRASSSSGEGRLSEGSGGRLPPKNMVRFNANLPEGLHRELKMQSVREGRTMTDIVEEAVRGYLAAR